ncbi:YitT family protein [Eubacterium sp. AF05-24]|uniref:YitT family protein n=1 Tax=Eubacterium sp. AF05-24 TaxID=2996995 RepID=UPI0022E26B89|nr:YitT family protein [Eubacterium sp. AF05-24]
MKDIIKIILGNIILTFAYALITVPNHIINGGVTSFSLIISQLINTDVTEIANIFTIILLLLSFIFLGKEFVLKSLLSSVCYMFFLSFFHVLPISFIMNPIICVSIAGIMVGLGYFLCISANASTVGFDVIALILNKKNRKFNVALTIRYIGIAILMFGIISFGISSVIYGILFTVIETSTLNICTKLRESKFGLKEEEIVR